jgi:hypothetical protein
MGIMLRTRPSGFVEPCLPSGKDLRPAPLEKRKRELYQTWLDVDQRGLKETPEYRNVLLRADRHALWLAGLVRFSSPDAAPPLSSKETQPIAALSVSQEAAFH